LQPGEPFPVLVEPADPDDDNTDAAALTLNEDPSGVVQSAPVFQGLRTADRLTYVEYADGARELYDLAADPDQLANAYGTANPTLVTQLAAWLNVLRNCAGATCRSGEAGPP
jgi:hypothetical protein